MTPMNQALPPESVWDYPRPAICEAVDLRLRVMVDGLLLADSRRGFRVLETSHPPCYYLPPEDVDLTALQRSERQSFCEWKGLAHYYDFQGENLRIDSLAWAYSEPSKHFKPLANYISFYASKCDACCVNEERVRPQPGDFYGGWITANLRGPFKGGPGSRFW